MSKETRVHHQKSPACAQHDSHFIWPISKSFVADEMNTSFGPRIDANLWDFHDGIDLPAAIGSPVYAMARGVVHRAGPADKRGNQGFGSTHVLIKAVDPTDGDDLFLALWEFPEMPQDVVVLERG